MIGVVVAVAVVVAVVSLRLMSGPIDLDFLKPRITAALDTAAASSGLRRPYPWNGAVSASPCAWRSGPRVTDMDRKQVATAQRRVVLFTPQRLRRPLFPTAIVVERPTLDADIDREGGMLRRILGKTDSDSQDEVVKLLVEQLLAEPNHHSLLGQLDTVIVEQARITLRDIASGTAWIAPAAHVSLKRDDSGVIIASEARFARDGSGEPIDVSLSGTYARDRSNIVIEAKSTGLAADVRQSVAGGGDLSGIDVSLSTRLNVEASGGGEIRKLAIEASGGRGRSACREFCRAPHRPFASAPVRPMRPPIPQIDRVDIDLGAAACRSGDRPQDGEGPVVRGRGDIRQIHDRLAEYRPIGVAGGGRAWRSQPQPRLVDAGTGSPSTPRATI